MHTKDKNRIYGLIKDWEEEVNSVNENLCRGSHAPLFRQKAEGYIEGLVECIEQLHFLVWPELHNPTPRVDSGFTEDEIPF